MTLLSDPKIKAVIDKANADDQVLLVNNHIHSPFSFSAFNNISQAVDIAVKEGVSVLGINDFFVTHGYAEFNDTCLKNKVYPLFNVEFIGLHKQFQADGFRINDPNNPGRIYISGKGLQKTFTLSPANQEKFDTLIESSQLQIKQMIGKLNDWLKELGIDFEFNYESVKAEFAKELVRERHIASAIRAKAESSFTTDADKTAFYAKLFGAAPASDINKPASIEDEIRGKLLKAGGKAFVEEDDKAFLSPAEIKSIISEAGGMITYPLLLDDKNGHYTDFEGDKEKLVSMLRDMGIYAIEFIPGRNSLEALKNYSEYFLKNGFLVSYGTEHNSPALSPLEVSCRGGVKLDESLLEINYKCSCVIAAHQYLIEHGQEGYLDAEGVAKADQFNDFYALGNALIKMNR